MSSFWKGAARILTLVLIVGVIGLIVIQFVPVERSNPAVVKEPAWDSSQTRALTKRACFDCHSNETYWPWYSKVAPVSWLVAYDVQEGRAALNYSAWKPNQENESVEVIMDGGMPPEQYLLMHPDARLSEAEVKTLIAGLKATFGDSVENEGAEAGEAHKFEGRDD